MLLLQGDCLKLMKDIPSSSVDMILCDLPYGITGCKWDSVIPFDKLWAEYRRILKAKGVCALFGNQPFTSHLISSNYSEFSHIWYWKKNNVTGALLAKKQPMRCIEDICIFICNQADNSGKHDNLRKYFFDELERSRIKRKDIDKLLNSSMSSHYFTRGKQFAIPSEANYKILQDATGCFQRTYEEIKDEFLSDEPKTTTYNPQGIYDLNKPKVRRNHENNKEQIYNTRIVGPRLQTKSGYPRNLIEFDNEVASNRHRLHPTQKPVALCEYLIKTYSNVGETVLDNCMGSGTTGVACVNAKRNFIGMEQDEQYFQIAKERIENAIKEKEMAVCQ